ncbi:helix-turn-helix domain-containing protein [Burkholderia alba]|uniref:helix-turn-helix domain-containing protein n=1 Tax=Burkholderia alba TaxID=2683677 RepID=UPI002B0536DD|nr:helix-turn-helix transcriptional regulator [Burkholderia alba]
MRKKEDLASLAATFVDTVRRLQKEAGVNDAELSRAINLNQGTLSRLLSGETIDPRLSTISALAKFFAVSISTLFGEEDQGFVPVFEQGKLQHASADRLTVRQDQFWIKSSKINISQFAIVLEKKARLDPLPSNAILIIGNFKSLDIGDLVVVGRPANPCTLAKIYGKDPFTCYDIESTTKRQPFPIELRDVVGKVIEIIVKR